MKKLMKIADLEMDMRYYPRMKTDWFQNYIYSQAMKAGAKFPPIAVARFGGKNKVVDGWHRVEARKILKEEYIEADILKLENEKNILLEAVKRNSAHGRQFSVQERTMLILRLQNMKIEKATIAELVGIPIKDWERVIGNKLSYTATGQEVVLKAPLEYLAGEKISQNIIDAQEMISARSDFQILDTVIAMLENKMFDLKNAQVVERLQKISELLKGI